MPRSFSMIKLAAIALVACQLSLLTSAARPLLVRDDSAQREVGAAGHDAGFGGAAHSQSHGHLEAVMEPVEASAQDEAGGFCTPITRAHDGSGLGWMLILAHVTRLAMEYSRQLGNTGRDPDCGVRLLNVGRVLFVLTFLRGGGGRGEG
jgi:hypothetical protein